MYSPLPSSTKAARVLFIARSESSVRSDVKSLRAAGVQAFVHTRESQAAIDMLRALLAEAGSESSSSAPRANAVDLVVCDEIIGDGPASLFLHALASDKALCSQPVLVLAATPASAKALRAAGVHVLERPYAASGLEAILQKAMSPMRRPLQAKDLEHIAKKREASAAAKARAQEQKSAAKNPVTSSGWLAKGLEHLKKSELAEAEQAFMQVFERQADNAEAALGMARVHRARENSRGVLRYLIKAAAACRISGDHTRANAITARLPERYRGNLFIHEAVASMQEDDYANAARYFLEASMEEEAPPLHRLISRACLITSSPDGNMEKICSQFERMGQPATGASLRRRLLSYTPSDSLGANSWLDHFPLLKETVSVVSHTAWVWRQV